LNAKELIRIGLDEYFNALPMLLDGLTKEERRYQPTPESHHIDFAVWHMARVEDNWIHQFAKGTEQIWIQHSWYRKLELPRDGTGYGFTSDEVKTLPVYDIDVLMSYYRIVAQETRNYLTQISQDQLNYCPEPDKRPGYSIGQMLSHIIVEESQHLGQISYIRGMLKGINN